MALETFLARYEGHAAAMAASAAAAAEAAQAAAPALTVARNIAEEEAIAARAEAERLELERVAAAKAEAERVERENAAARAAAEKAERERVEREKAERERAEREKAEREKAEREKAAERERVQRAERERALAARLAGERAEQEKAPAGAPQVEVAPLAASTVDRPRSKSGSRPAFAAAHAAVVPAASDEPGSASEDEALRALFSEPQEPAVTGVPTYWRHAAIGLAVLCLTEGAFIGVSYRQSLSILPSSGGTVHVDSKPVGAQVKIDGQPKGATPLSLQVSAGTHVMELSVGGEPRVIPITVNSGEALGQYVRAGRRARDGPSRRLFVARRRRNPDRRPAPWRQPGRARRISRAGDHQLILDLNGARTRQPVTIAAGTLTKVEVKLGPGRRVPRCAGAGAVPVRQVRSIPPPPCRRWARSR